MSILNKLRSQLRRQRPRLNMYRSPSGFLTDSYSRFLHNYPGCPLPWRGSLCAVHVKAMSAPVWIRLGSSDTTVLSEIGDFHEYEWIKQYVAGPVRVVFDLGGNCGVTMRYWAENFRGLEHMVVVEPDSDNFRVLKRNSQALSCRLDLVQACVVARHRAVRLQRGRSAAGFTMAEGNHGEQLATVTMEELLEKIPSTASVDFLKCDIEGTESELFENCGSWIHRFRNIVVEVHGDYTTDRLREAVFRAKGSFPNVIESPHRPKLIGFFQL